jgi:2-hydroxyacyl-CoA lyase 1
LKSALKEADLIVLLGARLNWMVILFYFIQYLLSSLGVKVILIYIFKLHFGAPPRFDTNTRFIQVDINAEELGNNAVNGIKVQADIRSFCEQLNKHLSTNSFSWDNSVSSWRNLLKSKSDKNKKIIEEMMKSTKAPMNYYSAYANVI